MRNPSKGSKTRHVHADRANRRAYRLREIEAEIGVPVSTLRAMIRRGDISVITAFGPWLIPAEEYERLLNSRLRNE
jgi:predicted site-specific integrase-resolvase